MNHTGNKSSPPSSNACGDLACLPVCSTTVGSDHLAEAVVALAPLEQFLHAVGAQGRSERYRTIAKPQRTEVRGTRSKDAMLPLGREQDSQRERGGYKATAIRIPLEGLRTEHRFRKPLYSSTKCPIPGGLSHNGSMSIPFG